jgi:hypothetical protein
VTGQPLGSTNAPPPIPVPNKQSYDMMGILAPQTKVPEPGMGGVVPGAPPPPPPTGASPSVSNFQPPTLAPPPATPKPTPLPKTPGLVAPTIVDPNAARREQERKNQHGQLEF